jgi:LuxR family quorum-sensing system transcriptional regulator CciR
MGRRLTAEEQALRGANRRRGADVKIDAPPPSRLVDEFGARASSCATGADLHRLLDEVSRDLGFDHFALLHHASLTNPSPRMVRLHSYPDAWQAELAAPPFRSSDPVHLACSRTNAGFCWVDLGTLVEVTKTHRRILERSRYHGIGEGFSVPANVPGEPAGSCSFAVRSGRSFPTASLLCAELVGSHAFRAARRICGIAAARSSPHLSRREIECLKLVAAGKTDWEVAAILGIAPDTARQYLKHARSAYDVVSRTQLVVHGLRDALISFDEAIAPT